MVFINMYDSKRLLRGLVQYQQSLEVHLNRLKSEYEQLQRCWKAFNAASEGNYAEQFRAGRIKTDARFQSYINQSQKINSFLEERIQFIIEFNETGIFDNFDNVGGNTTSLASMSSFPVNNQPENGYEMLTNGNINDWNIDEQTINELKYLYHKNDNKEDKKDLSQYIGEEYGHRMVTDILGYEPILNPIEKHSSFPQGFDGVYFDALTGEIVVTEFKGQNSSLSNLQEMTSYVDRICQEIIAGRNFPYTNAPESERDIAFKIKNELEAGNVRYEVYRTKFDDVSKTLSTILEKIIFPDLVDIIIPKHNSNKNAMAGILDNLENHKEILEEIVNFQAIISNDSLPNYERVDAQKILSEKLMILAKKIYNSGNLSRSEKSRLTRALNKYKP